MPAQLKCVNSAVSAGCGLPVGEGLLYGGDQLRVVGLDLGGEAGEDTAIAADQELLEVPEDSRVGVGGRVGLAEEAGELLAEGLARGAGGAGEFGDELLEERVGIGRR